MAVLEAPARIAYRLRHPQTTVRWRLTLLYGGLFLACGAGLLAITYVLAAHTAPPPVGPKFVRTGVGIHVPTLTNFRFDQAPAQVTKLLRSDAGRAVVAIAGKSQRLADLHQLIEESGIALAIMAAISALLGWLVAGRVLSPLQTMTTTTQEISEANLHQRLAMQGPRDELRTLADTIDGLLERLEGAFDAQRRFVANASHELFTPLTASRALLEMAISDPHATVETFRDICRQVLEEGEEQEQLIDALLALARGQRGIDRRETIDLATATGEALRAHEPYAAAGGLQLEASLAAAQISGDRRLIDRLVSNLVENAIRHNIPDGRVSVRVGGDAGSRTLQITNTGPLVPEAEVERLLQPFQRLAPDRVGRRDGLGLGLSIVAAIATAHDANLGVHPGEDGGLDIRVRFPPAADGPRTASADSQKQLAAALVNT